MAEAIKLRVSAPGKIILFGEHSVVYGKPAVAAAINKRTTLDLSTTSGNSINIQFENVNLDMSFNLEVMNEKCWESTLNYDDHSAKTVNHETLKGWSDSTVQYLAKDYRLDLRQRISLQCFLYLLRGMYEFKNSPSLDPLVIRVQSALTVGAGTGSSASFSVCLAAALYLYVRIKIGLSDSEAALTDKDKNQINDWAFGCEQIIHGKASGMDNITCTFGSLIKFELKSEENGRNVSHEVLPITKPIRVLLINSGISRNTAKMVQNVRNLYTLKQTYIENILEEIADVTNCASLILSQEEELKDENSEQKLGELISRNHRLLAKLEVSNESLNDIVKTAEEFGFYCKLTGAGGGGYAFAFIPSTASHTEVEKCKRSFLNKYTVEDVTLGASGVNIDMLNIDQ